MQPACDRIACKVYIDIESQVNILTSWFGHVMRDRLLGVTIEFLPIAIVKIGLIDCCVCRIIDGPLVTIIICMIRDSAVCC